MRNKIAFFIPACVQPKQADRSRIAVSKNGEQYILHYRDAKVVANAHALGVTMSRWRPAIPFVGPVRVTFLVCYPYRKSEPKKNRGGPILKSTAPDAGQLSKQIEDVLESCRFFGNDAQIADTRTVKIWCNRLGVYVIVEPIGDVADYESLFLETLGADRAGRKVGK